MSILLATVLACLVDFGSSLFVLLVLMLYCGAVPTLTILRLPAFPLMAIGCALEVSLRQPALAAQCPDINQLLPFLVQVRM